MIVGIVFLVVLLSCLWTVAILFNLNLALPIVPTAATLLAVAAIVVVRRVQARAAARAIEKTLKSQGDAFASQARPDQQPEIQALQSEFSKAVNALKTSKLARGGSDALGVLPWYLIIGPPGAGKSTALSKSGLQFPYLSAGGRGLKGVAGTRNCEWWLTNEAVILDTAGRYTTEDNDRDEWLSFLDMLGKNRPRRPLNGLLVAVSVGDFVELDEEGAATLGQRIRERIDEVMSRLKVVLPVYVLFTKCDLLAGFIETFGELNKNERGQIWGFTLPIAESQGAPGEAFAERFDELATQASAWSMDRLAKSRRVEDRERIFQFPAQFDGLRANLTEFIQTVFAPNVYQDTPQLRGVYFTSGTQEGRPIDRVMRAMASAFGLEGAMPESDAVVQDPKSYFLRDVFSRVIFKDQSIAVRSASASKRDQLLRRAYTAGGLTLAALLIIFPTVAFFRNLSLVHSTRDMVARLKGQLASSTGTLKALNPLRTQIEELVSADREGPPLTMRFGMYQGSAVLDQVRPFYGETVRDLVVRQVLEINDSDLFDFVKAPPPRLVARTHLPFWQALKLHLLLTTPRAENEPRLDESVQAWLQSRITRPYFAKAMSESSEEGQSLKAHVAMYLKLLSQDPSLALHRDPNLVERARGVLRNLPLADLALERVISEAAQQEDDLTLGSLLGGALPEYTSKSKIRAAFTKKAFSGKVGGQLKAGVKDSDAWVLGGAASTSVADVESAYFRAYINEWRTFLESIEVASMRGDRARVQTLLDDLTGGTTPPLSVLFDRLADNTRLETRLEQAGLDLKDRLVQKIQIATGGQAPVPAPTNKNDPDRVFTAADVRQAFEPFTSFAVSRGEKQPVPIDRYYEQLVVIRDGFRAEAQDPSALALRIRSARASLEGLLASQNAGLLRPVLYKLTTPPLDEAYKVVTGAQKSEALRNFCNGVGEPFRALAKRYPFAPVAADAPMADVADFFRPKTGQVWAFYDSNMKANVIRAGERFTNPSGGEHVYPPGIIAYLGRANDISRALFPPSSNDPQVPFAVHIHPVPKLAGIAFTVDGDTLDYRNGPEEWRSFKWPSPGKAPGASIRVRDPKGKVEVIQQEGEWGLLRLFEQGALKSSSSTSFTLAWRVPTLDAEIVIDVKPVRGETPFRVGKGSHNFLALFRGPGLIPLRECE